MSSHRMDIAIRTGIVEVERPPSGSIAVGTMDIEHQMLHDGCKDYFRCRDAKRQVSYELRGDGTALSLTDKLMWIRIPWGASWTRPNEQNRDLEQLAWPTVTKLFGRGGGVSLCENGTIALEGWRIAKSSVSSGYTPGELRVDFAGYRDWRLPTVADWHTVLGLDWDMAAAVFPLFGLGLRYWTATGREESTIEHTPGWLLRLTGTPRWPLAWAAGTGRSIIDCNSPSELPVMFVRSL